MRVGIDIRALTEGKITGVEVYITNLLKALFEIDQTNHYILFANSFTPSLIPSPLARDVTSELAGEGRERGNVEYKIFSYPNKFFNLSQKYLAFPKVDKLVGRVDLFFSPHWRALSLTSGIPLVVTFHDLSFESVSEYFTMRQRLWHRFMSYRRAALDATKLVAVSQSTKSDLMRLYHIPEDKIQVIYSGVKVAEDSEALAGLPSKYFLSIGTFEPRKNLEAVIAAYEEYYHKSRLRLPLVLAGSSGWKTSLKIPSAIEESVMTFQNVSEEKKKYLYEHAFALLFLSFYEGFGFPVLEAASLGVPVISSFATSLAEIGDGFALFVNPFRSSQVTEAMLALEEDQSYYHTLKYRGLETAKKFTWDKTARQMLNLFESLKS